MEFPFFLLPVLHGPIYLSGDLLDAHLLSPLCVSHCVWRQGCSHEQELHGRYPHQVC